MTIEHLALPDFWYSGRNEAGNEMELGRFTGAATFQMSLYTFPLVNPQHWYAAMRLVDSTVILTIKKG